MNIALDAPDSEHPRSYTSGRQRFQSKINLLEVQTARAMSVEPGKSALTCIMFATRLLTRYPMHVHCHDVTLTRVVHRLGHGHLETTKHLSAVLTYTISFF